MKLTHKYKYPCDQCNYVAKHKEQITTHVKSKHQGVKFNCDLCSCVANQKSHLSIHVKSKHEGVKFHCDQCDFRGSRRSSLFTHIKFNSDAKLSEHTDRAHVRHVCNQCNKAYRSIQDLQRHIDAVHLKIKKYSCHLLLSRPKSSILLKTAEFV